MYLSSIREGYAAISLLIPFLNPMSSIAPVEYSVCPMNENHIHGNLKGVWVLVWQCRKAT